MFVLVLLDLFWSGAAWWVDWPKLTTIPFWAWFFVIVCPIYPLLLAGVWLSVLRDKELNQYLLAFAALGSAILGIMAIVFYPATMVARGWDWNAFGQIFWVAFYSIQGWYLIFKYRIKLSPALIAFFYFLVKFTIDYKFKTFGYLDLAGTPNLALYLLALATTTMIATLTISRSLCRNRRQGSS